MSGHLKRGTIVTIYEDPLTRLKAEGQASIVRHLFSLPDGLESYEVRFLDDARSIRPRQIVEAVASEVCCCREQAGDDPDCKVHEKQVA